MDENLNKSFLDFDLMELAHNGNFSALNIAVDNIDLYDFDVNSFDKEKNTLLHYAAEKGDVELVKKLIERGSNVNATNSNRESPLHLACLQSNHLIVKILIKNQANVNLRNEIGETPLFNAISSKNKSTVNVLLLAGAQMNIKNETEETLLHAAVKVDDVQLVNFFIDNGISPKSETLCGETPLQMAIIVGSENVINYFMKLENDFNIYDHKERNLLHLAVKNHLLNTCKWLITVDAIDINHKDIEGLTPLHYAAELNYVDLIQLLLENKANINQLDNNNNTPLHLAAGMKDNGPSVEILLKYNARTDIKTYNGDLPLHVAAAKGNVIAVKLLYRPDHHMLINKYKMTPQSMAVETGRLNILSLFKYLDNETLEKNKDNDKENNTSKTVALKRRVSFSGISIRRRNKK